MNKAVLINFWATWCPPCVDEAPEMVKIYQRFHDQGVEFIGISLDKDRKSMTGFMAKLGMNWPQYYDGGGWDTKLSRRFGVYSIPTVWIIGPDGRIFATDARGELDNLLPKLLATAR